MQYPNPDVTRTQLPQSMGPCGPLPLLAFELYEQVLQKLKKFIQRAFFYDVGNPWVFDPTGLIPK